MKRRMADALISSLPKPGHARRHALAIRLPLRAEFGGQRLLLAPGGDHEKQRIHGEKRERLAVEFTVIKMPGRL
jgi:hypothetical protein